MIFGVWSMDRIKRALGELMNAVPMPLTGIVDPFPTMI
jgi:hypothetical protein